MTQEPKQNKRLVSKGAYAGLLATRSGLRAAANLLWFAGMMLSVYALLVLLFMVLATVSPLPSLPPFRLYSGGVVASLLLAGGSYLLFKGGQSLFERIEAMNNVLPLTRANTTHFPAYESLVRASQEATQAQHSVLLRATSGDTQTRNERQLLRGSAGA